VPQAVLSIVLGFVYIMLNDCLKVEVVHSPSDFILYLSSVEGESVSVVQRDDDVIEDVVNLHLPGLAVMSRRIGRIGQEGKPSRLFLEVSDFPDADRLALREKMYTRAERPRTDKLKRTSALLEVPDVEDAPLAGAGQQIEQFVAIYGANTLVEHLSGQPMGVEELVVAVVNEDLGFFWIQLRGDDCHSIVLK